MGFATKRTFQWLFSWVNLFINFLSQFMFPFSAAKCCVNLFVLSFVIRFILSCNKIYLFVRILGFWVTNICKIYKLILHLNCVKFFQCCTMKLITFIGFPCLQNSQMSRYICKFQGCFLFLFLFFCALKMFGKIWVYGLELNNGWEKCLIKLRKLSNGS